MVYYKLSFRDVHGHVLWFCGCDCGGFKIAQTGDLTTDRIKSCGCLKNMSGKDNPNWKGGKQKIACAYCGKEKSVYPGKIKAYNKIFCNDICRGKWMSENNNGQNNGRWKPKIKVFCAWCGKSKEVYQSHFDSYRSFFCNNTCRGKWQAKKVFGKKNPNFNNGTPLQRTLGKRISAGIRKSLKNGKNGYSWEKLLGYNRKQLFKHLNKTMPSGYTWNDLDGLHIDHIIPKTAFEFNDYFDAGFKACWALKNLQLLPAIENMKKGCRITI